ncbi:MAG TPA: helix-turn-helix domain-containing protein [Clostridiales bacterium]|nr:helix-turn-helix domain-containing protein [Clostridiales bacterium]
MEGSRKINNQEIGQRIRKEREKFGLSREELAEIVGLSDYYIGQLERGERQMSLSALVKIANCFHISLDYLIFGKNVPYEYDAVRENCNMYETGNESQAREIAQLLNKCSSKELKLFEQLIKIILPYLDKD